jgi:Amt family ammonium transporter
MNVAKASSAWRCAPWLTSLAVLAVAASTSLAQDKKDEKEEKKEPAATSIPTPPYFSGTNPKVKDPDTGMEKVEVLWPDPTGANSGTAFAPGADDLNKATGADLYHRGVHNFFSINMMWVLIAGFLVMFMQAGFALVETGLCRAKNAAHTISMNFLIYPLGCVAFWAYGFAFGWGNLAAVSQFGPGTTVLDSGIGIGKVLDDAGNWAGAYQYGLLGWKGFCLIGVEDVSVMALFFFMMVFMDTTATIPTGAMAERWSWKNFCIYGLWVAVPYCVYANWVWGGGWLAQMGKNWGLGHGAVDFAGSGVVHAMGGAIGLAGAICIGPRIGKYVNGKPQAMPGHHIPMVVVGTFILAFGWFGFNAGSTLAGTDLRISFVVVNTMLASVAGALGSMLVMQYVKGLKPDPSMMCNGMLAGLVAITAPCAFVSPWAAFVIGFIGGVIVVYSVFFWDSRGIDDPVGAISVHGVNGIWGLLAVGIFANGHYGAGLNGVDRYKDLSESAKEHWTSTVGVPYDGVRGLLYGDWWQFLAQCIDAAVVAVFGFVMAFVWFKLSDKITPLRVPSDVEMQGLDIPEMGALGYPDFTVAGRTTG